ncbi:hypothetical protein OC845_000301, partial [Tilletia horrida]
MGDKGLALSTQLAEGVLNNIKATAYNLFSVDYPMDDDDQADTSESESEVLISHFFKTKKLPAAERAKLGRIRAISAGAASLPELPLSDPNVAEELLLHHIEDQKLAALKGEEASVSTTPTVKSKLNLIEAVRANLAAVRKTTLALGAQALGILKHFKPLKWETAADLEPAIGGAGALQSNLRLLTELGFAAGRSTIRSKHWTVSFPARRELSNLFRPKEPAHVSKIPLQVFAAHLAP